MHKMSQKTLKQVANSLIEFHVAKILTGTATLTVFITGSSYLWLTVD